MKARLRSLPRFDVTPAGPLDETHDLLTGVARMGHGPQVVRCEVNPQARTIEMEIQRPKGYRRPRALPGGMAALLAVRTYQETEGLSKTAAIVKAAEVLEPHSYNGATLIRDKLKRRAVKAEARRLELTLWGLHSTGAICLALRWFDLERDGQQLAGWVNGWLWDSTRVDAEEINAELMAMCGSGGWSELRLVDTPYHKVATVTRE